jgi:uncharacterized coiled-coil DUF342 family protein
MGDMANDEREEAANAICNLRADLQNAYDRIKTLTDERDEARREADEYCRELRDDGGALGQFQREGE